MSKYEPFTIDFETTGQDATTAYPIEVGVASPDDGAWEYQSFIALPPNETIPPETSAVHHVIDEDLEGAPYWPEVLVTLANELFLPDGSGTPLLIAHNAEYEQGILANTQFRHPSLAQEGFPGVSWVCTYKCALVAWPQAPSHKNEGLRYWLKLGSNRGRRGATGAHSALHDAKVTAGIFNALYGYFYGFLAEAGKLDGTLHPRDPFNSEVIFEHMIAISNQPAQLPTCPIGEWRGKPWSQVDAGFLRWMINKPIDRADAIYCAKLELERRGKR